MTTTIPTMTPQTFYFYINKTKEQKIGSFLTMSPCVNRELIQYTPKFMIKKELKVGLTLCVLKECLHTEMRVELKEDIWDFSSTHGQRGDAEAQMDYIFPPLSLTAEEHPLSISHLAAKPK